MHENEMTRSDVRGYFFTNQRETEDLRRWWLLVTTMVGGIRLELVGRAYPNRLRAAAYVADCFGFRQLLATKNCCGLTNAQLFRQLL